MTEDWRRRPRIGNPKWVARLAAHQARMAEVNENLAREEADMARIKAERKAAADSSIE